MRKINTSHVDKEANDDFASLGGGAAPDESLCSIYEADFPAFSCAVRRGHSDDRATDDC